MLFATPSTPIILWNLQVTPDWRFVLFVGAPADFETLGLLTMVSRTSGFERRCLASAKLLGWQPSCYEVLVLIVP